MLARYDEHNTAIYNSRTGHSRAQSTLKAENGTRKLLNDCAAREGTAETKVTLQCLKQQILGIKISHKKIVPSSCGNQAQRAKTAKTEKSRKIDFIGKKENMPNGPQARPIELFWALCKKACKARKAQSISL